MDISKLKSVKELVGIQFNLHHDLIGDANSVSVSELEQFRQLAIQDYVNSLEPLDKWWRFVESGKPPIEVEIFDLSDIRNKDWDEKRIDRIGQNGNDALHYEKKDEK